MNCQHALTSCNDCEGNGCRYCDGRGYYEICRKCHEPMGSTRKKWKRAGRPIPWVGINFDTEQPRRPQCKDVPWLELLFALWAWHHEVDLIRAKRDPGDIYYINLDEVRKYPPDAVKVMVHMYGFPEKLVYAKLEKLDHQGLIEYGGTIRLAWPTEKGLRSLIGAGLVDSA